MYHSLPTHTSCSHSNLTGTNIPDQVFVTDSARESDMLSPQTLRAPVKLVTEDLHI